jgi:hypothetical protein
MKSRFRSVESLAMVVLAVFGPYQAFLLSMSLVDNVRSVLQPIAFYACITQSSASIGSFLLPPMVDRLLRLPANSQNGPRRVLGIIAASAFVVFWLAYANFVSTLR